MAIFDQSTTLESPPGAVAQAVQTSATPNDQFLVIRPDMLLIVLRDDVGYVHLLRPLEGGITQFRLIADTAEAVREAFRGRQPKEALSALVSTRSNVDAWIQQAVCDTATQQMTAVRQAFEIPPLAVLPSPIRPLPVMPLSSTPPAPIGASADIAAIFERKPFPGAGRDRAHKLPSGGPWNPDQLIIFAIFFAPASGIAMGINWRRLGKPAWMWPTILTSILLPIAILGIVFGLVGVFHSLQLLPGLLLLAGLNWGFVYALWSLQKGAYKTWDRMGNTGELLAHRYDFTRALLVGGGIMLVFIVFGLIGYNQSSQPNTFESSDVTITYPNMWAKQDINRVTNCQLPNIHCILVVSDARFGYTSIYLLKVYAPADITAQSAEQMSWSYLQEQYPSARLDGRGTTTIAGLQGARHFYYAPNPRGGSEMVYGMQIYFVKGGTLYEYTAESLNVGIFREHRQDIDQFIAGIKLK